MLIAAYSTSNLRTVGIDLAAMQCAVSLPSLINYEEGYKGQGGWETVLGRFPRGKGTLLDLEFLEDGMSNFSQR